MGRTDLWVNVGNQCLQLASAKLENMDQLTDENVGLVQKLVSIAIAIDQLNLQWAAQTRFGGAVFRGPALEPTREGN